MNRNQKIALGCGGAGCLGLIVVAVAGGLLYIFVYRAPYASRDYNFNVSTNRNINTNDNSDITANDNANDNSSNSSSTSVSSMSDDDKHKLYHAAFVTRDPELLQRVSVKLGLMNDDFTPGDSYQEFITTHAVWTIRNYDFIETIGTPEKARAYVDENFPN